MPKGPQKLRVTFGAATLTHYGGVYLLHRFFTRVGFKRAIAQGLRLIQRNNRYSVGEMLLALLYPMLLGLDRIEQPDSGLTHSMFPDIKASFSRMVPLKNPDSFRSGA
jgi:hypothetical protein